MTSGGGAVLAPRPLLLLPPAPPSGAAPAPGRVRSRDHSTTRWSSPPLASTPWVGKATGGGGGVAAVRPGQQQQQVDMATCRVGVVVRCRVISSTAPRLFAATPRDPHTAELNSTLLTTPDTALLPVKIPLVSFCPLAY
jgi:hypothetical protein